MSAKYLCLASVLVCSSAACSVRIADMTLTATKNIPALNAEVLGPVEGEDYTSFGAVNLEEAIDRAIENGNGNALTDAVLYQENMPFRVCYRVKGTAVRIRAGQQK